MKKLFTLILIGSAFVAGAQIELHKDGMSIGPAETIDSVDSSIDHFLSELYIVNNTGVSQTISFSRYRNYHTTGWTDQICDKLICFNCDNTTNWDRPNSPALTLLPGDSSIMQIKVYPGGIDGCAIYTYFIEDAAKVVQDSIQITYTLSGVTCVLGSPELPEIEYSAYPNPASDVLNIKADKVSSTDELRIFNILGEEVKRVSLVNGLNEINVLDLNNGVYFYSIFRSNEVIETKKIVVRH